MFLVLGGEYINFEFETAIILLGTTTVASEEVSNYQNRLGNRPQIAKII